MCKEIIRIDNKIRFLMNKKLQNIKTIWYNIPLDKNDTLKTITINISLDSNLNCYSW